MKVRCNQSFLRFLRPENSSGIAPRICIFWRYSDADKSSVSKHVSCPSSRGIFPEIFVSLSQSSRRLCSDPISGGIGPEMFVLFRRKNWRLWSCAIDCGRQPSTRVLKSERRRKRRNRPMAADKSPPRCSFRSRFNSVTIPCASVSTPCQHDTGAPESQCCFFSPVLLLLPLNIFLAHLCPLFAW